MNLVMQFRKVTTLYRDIPCLNFSQVCNHPELFERADVVAPYSFCQFAETASLAREGDVLHLPYSTQNPIIYPIPQLFYTGGGLIGIPSERSSTGFRLKLANTHMSIWANNWITQSLHSSCTSTCLISVLDQFSRSFRLWILLYYFTG
jgi:chromatin-remodeling ATPase INO80